MSSAETPRTRAVTAKRNPTQDRSQASLDRMVQAAVSLMMERASEDFTLLEVSQLGKVSIGSIYHLLRSKDDLVRAVFTRELANIRAIEQLALDNALSNSRTLDEFIPRFVSSFCRTLRDHGLMLRLAMRRSAIDAEVSTSGDNRVHDSAEALAQALLIFDDEIVGETLIKGRMILQVIFAALARHLNTGLDVRMANAEEWEALMRELGIMALAYLKYGEPDS